MFSNQNKYSLVSGVLPNRTANRVLDEVIKEEGAHAFLWHARGTLVYDSWRKAWLPSISPAKSVFQMVLPSSAVPGVVDTVIQVGRLHQQATGAIFSSPCEGAYLGAEFPVWKAPDSDNQSGNTLRGKLSVIYCILSRKLTDKVSRAAIAAGAHGPIIYYAEGRGLRDRLGWLRITKEREKEVLMVLCDSADAEEMFDVMAKAGELHLPGRGFMYRMDVDTGLFNLPSIVSHHHYKASMQQIINTIDHLAGHDHWRDQSAFDIGGSGRGAGKQAMKVRRPELKNQVALSAIVKRSQTDALMELLLDSGVPGLNLNLAKMITTEGESTMAGARVNDEYGLLRCITSRSSAATICAAVQEKAASKDIADLCVLVNNAPQVATYVAGNKDYRRKKDTPPDNGKVIEATP